jgi:hypothetical protein
MAGDEQGWWGDTETERRTRRIGTDGAVDNTGTDDPHARRKKWSHNPLTLVRRGPICVLPNVLNFFVITITNRSLARFFLLKQESSPYCLYLIIKDKKSIYTDSLASFSSTTKAWSLTIAICKILR